MREGKPGLAGLSAGVSGDDAAADDAASEAPREAGSGVGRIASVADGGAGEVYMSGGDAMEVGSSLLLGLGLLVVGAVTTTRGGLPSSAATVLPVTVLEAVGVVAACGVVAAAVGVELAMCSVDRRNTIRTTGETHVASNARRDVCV